MNKIKEDIVFIHRYCPISTSNVLSGKGTIRDRTKSNENELKEGFSKQMNPEFLSCLVCSVNTYN